MRKIFDFTSSLTLRLLGSFAFLLIALRNPITRESKKDAQKNGMPVMIMLDVSKSMHVGDIKIPKNYKVTSNNVITPDSLIQRLDAAKYIIEQILISYPENTYGLGVFAGGAQGMIPLTNNLDQFLTLLSGIDYTNVYTQGTNLNQAIEYGMERLLSNGNTYIDNAVLENRGVLILLSDGGDEVFEAAEFSDGLSDLDIYVLGVGSVQGGPIIEGRSPFGGFVYKQYQGETVRLSLNESALKSLSDSYDATYIHIKDDASLKNMLTSLLDTRKRSYMVEVDSSRSLELIWVGIAFFCFMSYIIGCILSGKRN